MTIAEMIKLGIHGFKPADIKEINAAGIATDQIIDLAKNGYSTADVKELISLAGEVETVQPGNEEQPEKLGPADQTGNEGDTGNDEYKKQLEAQAAELEKLKKQLETAQNKNASRNLGPGTPEDPEEKVKEIFKDIY